MSLIHRNAERPAPDRLLTDIADYVLEFGATGEPRRAGSRATASWTRSAAAFSRSAYPACTKLLGPIVPGASLSGGARVPGTRYELDPVTAAFNIGTLVRWLDFNDTWLAAEWGHPSDNLGAISRVADYLSRNVVAARRAPLDDGRRAHGDDQGARDPGRARAQPQLQPRRARSRAARADREHGGGHATCSAAAASEIVNAVSNAWLDGGALRTYRHAPNTGSRKSWAAGDATSRGVRHALLARCEARWAIRRR